MPTPAQNAATAKYQKKNVRRFVLLCNRKFEDDIISWLETKDNVNGYLKELIRADIKHSS